METLDKVSSKIKEQKSTDTKGSGNAIFTIHPYKDGTGWYFDDAHRNIHREAFICGADGLLDLVCKGAEKCTARFSDEKFPDYDLTLALIESQETGSGDYYCTELKHDLWLCSVLSLFFGKPPTTIYLKIIL